MIEAVMLWNEPNNQMYWNTALDPEWDLFARMVRKASAAVRAENPHITIVVGGVSPVESRFMAQLRHKGVFDAVDVVAVQGFPFDWDSWSVEQWPALLADVEKWSNKPVWVTQVGASSFGADEPQEMGLRRTAQMLNDTSSRVYWYCLYDPPAVAPAAAYRPDRGFGRRMRYTHMGLLREDNTPKPACRVFAELTPRFGLCQWFNLFDPRLEAAVRWMKGLGVSALRTGLSWAGSEVPAARQWYDRQMGLLEPFDTCITFCFTPKSEGIEPHPSSPPVDGDKFAEFCAAMVRRYA